MAPETKNETDRENKYNGQLNEPQTSLELLRFLHFPHLLSPSFLFLVFALLITLQGRESPVA